MSAPTARRLAGGAHSAWLVENTEDDWPATLRRAADLLDQVGEQDAIAPALIAIGIAWTDEGQALGLLIGHNGGAS